MIERKKIDKMIKRRKRERKKGERKKITTPLNNGDIIF
jgi:hypothetical protein